MADPVVQLPGDQDTAMEGTEPSTPQAPNRAGNPENPENVEETPAAGEDEPAADPMEEETLVAQNPGQRFIEYVEGIGYLFGAIVRN